jgi:hypothetical protein
MNQNFVNELSKITSKSNDEIMDMIGDMSISDIYTLMNLVHQGSNNQVKDLLNSLSTNSEETMESKDKNKIVVPKSSKPRDSAYADLIQGQIDGRFSPSRQRPANKKTKMARQETKHKGRSFDEAVSFWTKKDAFKIVSEQFGHDVSFDGKFLKTDSKSWESIKEALTTEGFRLGKDYGDNMTKKIEEGVMGMTTMPGLRRMMELAGMPMDDVEQMAPDQDMAPAMDSADDMGMDDGMGDDIDPVEGGDFDVDPLGADEMGAVSEPMVSNSPAYDMIDQALNTIQNSLPDVKISEYKTLIQRLEELQVQLQQIGKSFLGD